MYFYEVLQQNAHTVSKHKSANFKLLILYTHEWIISQSLLLNITDNYIRMMLHELET